MPVQTARTAWLSVDLNIFDKKSSVEVYGHGYRSAFVIANEINSNPGYTAITNTCILCHNDTGFPVDTDLNGIAAPYKRPHNDTVMCEDCHGSNPHSVSYVRKTGGFTTTYTSTASCDDCHQNSLPGFDTAPEIPNTLKHSSNTSNGTIWNSTPYWTSGNSSCYYCHGDTKHNSTPLGMINNLLTDPNNSKNGLLTTTTWCADCHYNNSNPNYKGDLWDPVPPLITFNNTGKSRWVNHSSYLTAGYRDSNCKSCHALNGMYSSTSLNYSHSLNEGTAGKPNCIACHNTGGSAGEGKLLDFESASDTNAIHKGLNSGASSPSGYSSLNFKCWACHGDGDGSETAQPADGHPLNYRTPKNCNNNDCHSISQSRYKEPMIYSHFQNSTLNSNPENHTNYNITAKTQCHTCHTNSLVNDVITSGLAPVSHYGSKEDLVDSFNCIYCHLDKDNSEDWGNATLINNNRTDLIGFDRERNKFTAFEGDSIYLGEGYSLMVKEISIKRDEALVQLLRNGNVMAEFSQGAGTVYEYEEEIVVDNSTFKTPVITLNITSIFNGGDRGFIQFEGFRMRKIHTDKESKNSACYACHLNRYSTDEQRFIVIDREYKEHPDEDIIYYSKVLLDFKSENKSKIYFNEEDHVFNLLENLLGKFFPVSAPQKYLRSGWIWDISDNYSLKLNEVSTDSQEALLALSINNSIVAEEAVKIGSEFRYTPEIKYKEYTGTDVTVFSAKVKAIFQGRPDFIILQDVVALSPWVMKTTADTTLFGHNSSWLWKNDTITIGKIPENLHSPNMFTDQGNWGDCVRCHDTSRNLRIKDLNAISSKLGKHSALNAEASNETFLTDTIDKACWACHSDGTEPQSHVPAYIIPRSCPSCHTDQKDPSYGAIYVGDELHGNEPDCKSCHTLDSHNLVRFEVTPVIREAELSQTSVKRGENVELVVNAQAGYRMKIRAAEYFIDSTGGQTTGMALDPVDGTFDSQREELIARIDTADMPAGEHVIHIRAMERDNRWGEFYKVNFIIVSQKSDNTIFNNTVFNSIFKNPENKKTIIGSGIISLITVFMIAYLVVLKRR